MRSPLRAVCRGANEYQQLGRKTQEKLEGAPGNVTGLRHVLAKDIAVGPYHGLAICAPDKDMDFVIIADEHVVGVAWNKLNKPSNS